MSRKASAVDSDMDRSVAALKVLEESKISKAPPPRRRAIIPKAKPAAVSSVADKSSRPRLAAILEMHREKFGGREDTSEGSDVEMESSSEDEEADSDDEDSDSSDDEELKADLEPMQAIIGSSLKTATAGAPPPPTRAARDPFPVPPPGSVLSGTIILENHMKEEHKPLVVCTETFSVAVTVAGEANGAPIFRAFELLWAFRLRHENAMDVDNWRGLSPMLSYTIDSSTKSRPTEHELFRIDSYDWSDLTSLSPPLPNDGKDVKIIGIMVAVDSVEIRLRLTGVPFILEEKPVVIPQPPSAPPRRRTTATSNPSTALPTPRHSTRQRRSSTLDSDSDLTGDLSSSSSANSDEESVGRAPTTSPSAAKASRSRRPRSAAPDDPLLRIPIERRKAVGTAEELKWLLSELRDAASRCGVSFATPGDGSPRPRVSSPTMWFEQWRNINKIGESLDWEASLPSGKVISFGPENVGAVLCWGNNWCDHLRTYRALVAQEPTDKDVRDLIARNGTSLTTLRSLKIFLGVSDATSSPSKSPVKRRISSSSGDDSDAAGRSRRSKSTPQRRSAGGKAKSGGSSLISAISSPQLLLGLLLLALAAPVSAQSLRLRDLAKSLPSDFTALQLFIVVGLVIANLQLARLSQAQLVATSHQSRGRARFTSWIRAVSKLIFLSNPSAELSKESVYSAVELVAEAVEAELEQGDLDAIERSGRPRAPHTLLVTNYTSCPQCDRGYIQKLSSSHDVVLLDVDGPREASVLKAICTHCRTRFTPDRYRVRMPHSNRAVQVLDGTAKFVRLGAKYWATRRLANSLLLQHYHHMSFAAVSTAYHEGLDEDNLSRADRQHFFKLFVLEIVLRHSESTASPFLIDPLWSFTELIQSADLELFAGGRRILQHECTMCCHRARDAGDVPTGVGGANDVAGPNHDGADPAQAMSSRASDEDSDEEEDPAWVNMWVLDGLTIGPISCAQPGCTRAPRSYRSVTGRWCTEHQEEFFGPECYEAACGVIGCEETMVRRTLFSNPLLPPEEEDREITEEDELLEKYPCCVDHRQALDDFLARNGNPKDFHAVQNWNRDARNAAPRARPDENAPWRQKHSEHSSRVVQSTWHPQRYNNLSMLVRPCGVPVSATRMLMSESEDETIKFLKETFELIDPGKAPRDNRPSFLVYDRGCKALARLIETDEWEEWEETTRLLDTDELCTRYCNPAPLDGSQPDLVIPDPNDPDSLLRAWNTSASEQNNAWVIGFAPSLNRMRGERFDFFIHSMLWFHGKRREKSLVLLDLE